jgi:hypothetical protein
MTRGNTDSGLYIGVDYQHYNPHPDDPTDEVRGTEWDFKIAADVETLRNESPIYFSVAGEYSTSFQTYWARARIGRTLKGFIFGPEGVALGNVGFDAQRIGGFFICDWKALPLMSPIEVTHRDLDEDAAEVVDQCACGLRATSRSMTRAAIRRRHWILRRLWRKANSSGYSTASTRGSVLSADGHVKRWAIHISNSRTAPSHGPFATSMRPAMRLPHKNLLCSLAGIRSFPPKAQV